MTSVKHGCQTAKMEFERDPSAPYQFRYTFEDALDEEIISANQASHKSKMELGRDPSSPNQFRHTFEDNLQKGNDQRHAREPNLENGVLQGTQARHISFGTLLKTNLKMKRTAPNKRAKPRKLSLEGTQAQARQISFGTLLKTNL